MTEITIRQIWHLRALSEPPDRWYFTANYKLDLENSKLRNRLQGETNPPLSLGDLEPHAAKVRILVEEVRGRLEGPHTIEDGGFTLHATRRLDRLMRKPRQEGRESHLICVADVVDSSGDKVTEHQELIELTDLSSASQAAVHRLDLRALEESHLLFSEKAEALDEHPEGVIAPSRKVTVFISYRRSHLETAQRLHGILQSLGGGTIFDPYLDLHDMQSGKWKPRLLERIQSSALFMPLVSSDYGEDGSVSQEEYAKANEVAAAEGFDDFFVPIILGEVTSAVAKELLEYDAHLAASIDDVDLELGDFGAWIGRVAEAGFRRSVSD